MRIQRDNSSKISVSKRKLTLAFIAIALVCSLASGSLIYVVAQGSSTPFTISSGSYPGASTYTVWVDDGVYYAKNSYGEIPAWGTSTNATSIFNMAVTNGGEVKISSGIFILSNSILLTNRTYLLGEGKATKLQLATGVNVPLIALKDSSVEQTTIENMWLDGNGNTADGILINNVESFGFSTIDPMHIINNVLITNFNGFGVNLDSQGCREVQLNNVYCYENYGGFQLFGGNHRLVNCVAGNNYQIGFSVDGYGDYDFVSCKAFGNGLDSGYSNRDGFYIGPNPRYIRFTSCVAQDNYRFGFTFYNTKSLAPDSGHILTGCDADHNGLGYSPLSGIGTGLMIDNSTRIQVNGGQFFDRYSTGKVQDYGIVIRGNSTYIQLVGVGAFRNNYADISNQSSFKTNIVSSWNGTIWMP